MGKAALGWGEEEEGWRRAQNVCCPPNAPDRGDFKPLPFLFMELGFWGDFICF